jgi:hypothetical protein
MPIDVVDLLRDLEVLEELGLVEIDREGDVPRWWPTAKARASFTIAEDVDVDVEGV